MPRLRSRESRGRVRVPAQHVVCALLRALCRACVCVCLVVCDAPQPGVPHASGCSGVRVGQGGDATGAGRREIEQGPGGGRFVSERGRRARGHGLFGFCGDGVRAWGGSSCDLGAPWRDI
eukprot:3265765-Prymnesium_polylepis.1